MATTRRATRANVEDRWHRPPRNGEVIRHPADNIPGEPTWCTIPTHLKKEPLVCTARHGQGLRYQVRWVSDGLERSKSFAKKADAERHLHQVISELQAGTHADPKRSAVAFGTVAESWLQTKEAANRAPKTVAGYRGLLDTVILPKWRDERLRDITHERLQDWVTWLATNPAARKTKRKDQPGAGLSPARVIQAHQVVRQVLAYAIRNKYIAVNPAETITLPRKPEGKEIALTHAQVRELAEATANATVRQRSDTLPSRAALAAMVRFLSYSGVRFGEAVALRVGDVDLSKRRVAVARGITGVPGRGRMEGDTKNHQRRTVPILTSALVDELRAATEGRDPSEFLFPGPDGAAMTVGWFRVRFDKGVANLGLGDVTPHTLRHTAGSLALSEGASVVTVQKLLGHRNATTTMNVYSHMLPDDFDNLAAAMDKATIR